MVCAKYGSLRDSPVHRTFEKNRIHSFGTICVHLPVIIVFFADRCPMNLTNPLAS